MLVRKFDLYIIANGEFMAYITSKNLKNIFQPEDTHENYAYLIGNGHAKMFCRHCRMISDTNDNEAPKTCPCCGLQNMQPRYMYSDYLDKDTYHIPDIIDSMTINKNVDENHVIQDINMTILYRNYAINTATDHVVSYQYYKRVTFNFDTKQIYYTKKQVLSHKVNFSHFKIYMESVVCESDFAPLIPMVVQQIYDAYEIPINPMNYIPFHNSLPQIYKSPTFAFMCLKFPVVMIYLYRIWSEYSKYNALPYNRERTNTLNMHAQILYWSCNYDKTLKKALTATSMDEYDDLTQEVVGKFTSDMFVVANKIRNPIFVVYARFMYMLGFREITSVEKVMNHMMNFDSADQKISMWFFDMIRKRHHTRNKFYRRLLKHHSETYVIDMLETSTNKTNYFEFHQSYNGHGDIDLFYDVIDDYIDQIDFSDDIDTIFSEYVNLPYSHPMNIP